MSHRSSYRHTSSTGSKHHSHASSQGTKGHRHTSSHAKHRHVSSKHHAHAAPHKKIYGVTVYLGTAQPNG